MKDKQAREEIAALRNEVYRLEALVKTAKFDVPVQFTLYGAPGMPLRDVILTLIREAGLVYKNETPARLEKKAPPEDEA